MSEIFLALSSNKNAEHNLQYALNAIKKYYQNVVVSSLYTYPAENKNEVNYINQVVKCETSEGFKQLYDFCKQLEKDCERQQSEYCSLDIDILNFCDTIDLEKNLPHSDIINKIYVLQPLLEIVGQWVHPQTQYGLLYHFLLLSQKQHNNLAIPTDGAIEHSVKLMQSMQDEMRAKENQMISFAEYMQMALYEPQLGYYVSGNEKFAEQGDFITAPDVSPLFALCVAHQCQQVLSQFDQANILEFGAGNGSLAIGILQQLETQQQLPEKYYILEPSHELVARQKHNIAKQCPDLFARCQWLTKLPENFIGVVLANEVLDAMPVHQFVYKQGEFFEYYVDKSFSYRAKKICNERLLDKLKNIDTKAWPDDFHSEISLAYEDWIQELFAAMSKGVVLLLDYGFARQEYYLPQRHMGTLMCHYRHHTHDDVFYMPGLQDITAHVDFTAVVEAGDAAGFEILGYCNQANFLLNCQLLQYAAQLTTDPKKQLQVSQQIGKLTASHEMGEFFKVLALGKEMDIDLLGFQQGDRLHTL